MVTCTASGPWGLTGMIEGIMVEQSATSVQGYLDFCKRRCRTEMADKVTSPAITALPCVSVLHARPICWAACILAHSSQTSASPRSTPPQPPTSLFHPPVKQDYHENVYEEKFEDDCRQRRVWWMAVSQMRPYSNSSSMPRRCCPDLRPWLLTPQVCDCSRAKRLRLHGHLNSHGKDFPNTIVE